MKGNLLLSFRAIHQPYRGTSMELWSELLSDSTGIMSALVIAFMILMGVWFTWYFITHMMNDKKKD